MSVELTINGTPRMMADKWSVKKRFASESFDFAVEAVDIQSVYYPETNDTVRLTHNTTDLVFGGLVAGRRRGSIGDSKSLKSHCKARDWMFLAEQMFVHERSFPSQEILTWFNSIIAEYIAHKGVTNISAPSGGVILPRMFVDTPTTQLLTILKRVEAETGWFFRINGDKQAAMLAPGSLIYPGPTFTHANAELQPDVEEGMDLILHANRLWVQTVPPDVGENAPFIHEETFVFNGSQNHMPVSVIPTRPIGRTVIGYASGVGSIQIEGLPANQTLLAGIDTFEIPGSELVHLVSANVTTDDDGIATVTFSPVTDVDLPEKTDVVFSNRTFVRFELNGTPTTLDAAPWNFFGGQGLIFTSGTLPSNGDVGTYRAVVTHPVWVRAWNSEAVDTDGNFKGLTLIDGFQEEAEHTTIEGARAYATRWLSKRGTIPKKFTFTTRVPGVYPLLSIQVDFADYGFSGTCLVEEVTIKPLRWPSQSDDDILYTITCVEGDELGPVESWIEYYKSGIG